MNEIMMNNYESKFDMQQLMNITGQTALNVNQMSKQMGILTSTINDMQDNLGALSNRMDAIENTQEITTMQKDVITEVARKRVVQIIGDDPLEMAKYFRIFVQNLYKDARKYAGLSYRIEKTQKHNYQRILDYIEAWNPQCGCAAIRNRADQNAKARMEAKNLGYSC